VVRACGPGTPREIITQLNGHFRKVLASPEMVRKMEQTGVDVIGSTPEEAAEKLKSELKKYATLIKERGMRAD